MTLARTEGRIAARLESVRKFSHRGAGAGTVGDTDGFGTYRRRMGTGQMLLLLVVVLGRLSWRDAIHHRALESLRLLHSLHWSLHPSLYTRMVILRLQGFNVCIWCQ